MNSLSSGPRITHSRLWHLYFKEQSKMGLVKTTEQLHLHVEKYRKNWLKKPHIPLISNLELHTHETIQDNGLALRFSFRGNLEQSEHIGQILNGEFFQSLLREIPANLPEIEHVYIHLDGHHQGRWVNLQDAYEEAQNEHVDFFQWIEHSPTKPDIARLHCKRRV